MHRLWISYIFVFSIIFGTYASDSVPFETRSSRQTQWKWMTDNNYRIIMQCRPGLEQETHRVAWGQIDIEKLSSQLKIAPYELNRDSIRVIEYNSKTFEPVKHRPGNDTAAYFVPAKIDEWTRWHQSRTTARKPHISWIRRNGDEPAAIYICYFDVYGRGEQQRIAKPAFIGTGDALAYGKLGTQNHLRGVPLVYDWDGDGDNDMINTLGTVPERGTFLSINNGDAMKNGFEKRQCLGVDLGIANQQVTDVNKDGKMDAVKPGGYYSDFAGEHFSKWVQIDCPLDNENGKIINECKRKQWFITDWDADGVNDLIFGGGWWKEYGWADAYDEEGNWENGPLHGWFYVFRNEGTNKDFKLAEPFQIKTTAGVPADVYGYPSPIVIDLDGDGDLDLVSGNFLDKIKVFINTGSRENPQLAPPVDLMTREGPFECDYQALTLHTADWDNDGDPDIFIRCENDYLGYLENTGKCDSNGSPIFEPVRYPYCQADYLCNPQLVTNNLSDWDNDGIQDLIVGSSPGYVGWYECIEGYPEMKFDQMQRYRESGEDIRIIAGPNGSIQGPAEAKWGYTVPWAADWDGDGYKDIMLNSIWGKIVWYRNPGKHGAQELLPQEPVKVKWFGDAPKPEWRWWNPAPDEWSTQWRSTVQMLDYDKDGLMDAAALDYEGYLVLHQRVMDGGRKILLPGRRIFRDGKGQPWQINPHKPGSSGRRKFEFCDWDNDGDWDLIVDDKRFGWKLQGNVMLYTNVSDNNAPMLMKNKPLGDILLAGHTCCPSVFDLEGDGKLDLLIGAEDGHFYCFHRSYIDNKFKLQAALVDGSNSVYSQNQLVLFDDASDWKIQGGNITDRKAYSGTSSIYTENNKDGFYYVAIDIDPAVDIMQNSILSMRVNCEVDDLHRPANLRWVDLTTLPNDNSAGTVTYYPDNNHGVRAADYRVDNKRVTGSIVFDDDSESWQTLSLDLKSSPGIPVIDGLTASTHVRKIKLVFKHPVKLFIDDIVIKSRY
jgi:hypothetical protein